MATSSSLSINVNISKTSGFLIILLLINIFGMILHLKKSKQDGELKTEYLKKNNENCSDCTLLWELELL